MANISDSSRILVYNGNKPYVFISYSHKDAKAVAPIIFSLQERGYRVWYDVGIKTGVEWTDFIASKIRMCSAFILFASKNSVKSERCRDELEHVKKHNKPALMVFIEKNISVPEGVEMQTARFQRISRENFLSDESFINGICDADFLDDCKGDYTKEDIYGILRGEKERIAQEKKRNRKAKLAAIAETLKRRSKVIIIALIALFALLWITVISPNDRYNKANECLLNGEYAEAYKAFEKLRSFKDSQDKCETLLAEHKYLKYIDADVGGIVVFGKYEQDNNWENGYDDIEWIVLENSDNKLLLVSKYALDCKQYHKEKKMVDWNGSFLRSWLNSNFYNGAFSDEEKKAVMLTEYTTIDNNDYGTPGGYDTQDYVFLLNLEQLRGHKYF